MHDIAVSMQAEPADLQSWLALARRLESAGFGALLLGDHPGSGASPWPALGSAAAVTQTLALGTYVIQAGVREPVHVAADGASLDVLAPGRVRLGLGAGHTPREWDRGPGPPLRSAHGAVCDPWRAGGLRAAAGARYGAARQHAGTVPASWVVKRRCDAGSGGAGRARGRPLVSTQTRPSWN